MVFDKVTPKSKRKMSTNTKRLNDITMKSLPRNSAKKKPRNTASKPSPKSKPKEQLQAPNSDYIDYLEDGRAIPTENDTPLSDSAVANTLGDGSHPSKDDEQTSVKYVEVKHIATSRGSLQYTQTSVRRRDTISTSSVSIEEDASTSDGEKSENSLQDLVSKIVAEFSRLPNRPCKIFKWLIHGYFMWLATSQLMVSCTRHTINAVAPICYLPLIGPQLQLCVAFHGLEDRSIDGFKFIKPQIEFTNVTEYVGKCYSVATDIASHEHTIQDLRTRVKWSKMDIQGDLMEQLNLLVYYTRPTVAYVI